MPRGPAIALLASFFVTAACAENPIEPAMARLQSFADSRANTGCVATTAVASSEAELNALFAAAEHGDVIAVSGMVVMTDAVRPPAGVTLTCAQPGDGVTTAPGYAYLDLIEIAVPEVTLQGLTIHGGSVMYAVYAERSTFEIAPGITANGVGLRLVGNTVTCGFGGCAFLVGSEGSIVADNHFTSWGSGSGVHIQGNGPFSSDGIRVERNRLVAAAPAGAPSFGAIRPRDGDAMVVADNVIVGPWSNGIATTEVRDSKFERNNVDGATRFGLFVGSTVVQYNPITVRGLLARGNTLHGAVNAIHVNVACGNVFVGNRLSTPSGTPVFFTNTTGANNLMGENSLNVDNGNYDCDGDGSVDPNFLSGRKRAGAAPGETMRDVMPQAGRVAMQ